MDYGSWLKRKAHLSAMNYQPSTLPYQLSTPLTSLHSAIMDLLRTVVFLNTLLQLQ